MTPQHPDAAELPPTCRGTADLLNRLLDGELDEAALDADPHPASCAACRERVAAARLLSSVLATSEPAAVPAGMSDRVLAAVREDRLARIRRRSFAGSVGACAVLAASVLLFLWLFESPPEPPPHLGTPPALPDVAHAPPAVAPEPRPAAPPFRIGDELAKAGQAFRDAPRTITEPAAAPDMLSKLTDALTRPLEPMEDMGPARAALADLPEAARAGLAPVTETAQKAFSRLLRDVTAIGTKPKS